MPSNLPLTTHSGKRQAHSHNSLDESHLKGIRVYVHMCMCVYVHANIFICVGLTHLSRGSQLLLLGHTH